VASCPRSARCALEASARPRMLQSPTGTTIAAIMKATSQTSTFGHFARQEIATSCQQDLADDDREQDRQQDLADDDREQDAEQDLADGDAQQDSEQDLTDDEDFASGDGFSDDGYDA
jgi:hypothetical protein